MKRTITAIFATRALLEKALRNLDIMGIDESQIGVVMSDNTHGKSFKIESHSKADEGLAAGATFGGIVGGFLAVLAGAGTLAIPGLNLVVAGSVVSGLAGASLGAAAGGIVGGLIGMGIPEHEAKLYEGKISAGHILLAVEARDENQASLVHNILKEVSTEDIAA